MSPIVLRNSVLVPVTITGLQVCMCVCLRMCSCMLRACVCACMHACKYSQRINCDLLPENRPFAKKNENSFFSFSKPKIYQEVR